jgi:ABC-type Mn2+/Zn2+ transport system ATPase subunit
MVGPNGAGKSTLMKTILGLVSPLAGKVSLGGFADRPGGIAYLPQKDTLSKGFPVSAVQVVLMGLAPRKGLGRPFNSQDRHKAMESLQSVGLERAAHQPFGQLSGGEQQRVLLARALIGEPGMLMLDEPTTGMDVDAGRQILHLVTELTEKRRQTVLMISHMLDDIRSHTHKVIYVHRLNGTIRIGTPDEILGDPCVNEPTFEGES